MKRLTAGLLLASGVLLALPAQAQLSAKNGPIDITADQLELIDADHEAIWSGAVEALQDRDRMHSDVLKIYFQGKPGADKGSSGGGSGGVPASWGKVERMEAEGHVFFVTPSQTARGDHAVYQQGSNTVTITGDVIVAQGQSVVHGDKLVIDTKTNHATMVSTGANGAPARVRGIFYPNQSDNTGGPTPPPTRNP